MADQHDTETAAVSLFRCAKVMAREARRPRIHAKTRAWRLAQARQHLADALAAHGAKAGAK